MRPVDLTMDVSDGMPAFPGSPRPAFIPWASPAADGYEMEMLFLSSHTGTHVDAPRHFARGGPPVDRIPPSRLAGPAVLLRAPRGARRLVTAADVARLESAAGRIPAGAAAVVATGWSDDPRRPRYFEDCPGLSAGAARLLAARRPSLVGIDSPSVDAGRSRAFPAHRALAAAGVPVVENLANLGRVPGPRFTLAVLPLKLRGASGAPARAVAL